MDKSNRMSTRKGGSNQTVDQFTKLESMTLNRLWWTAMECFQAQEGIVQVSLIKISVEAEKSMDWERAGLRGEGSLITMDDDVTETFTRGVKKEPEFSK